MKDTYALTVEVRTGESLSIDGGNIILKVEEKSGQRARIRFQFKQQTEVRKIVPGASLIARQGIK